MDGVQFAGLRPVPQAHEAADGQKTVDGGGPGHGGRLAASQGGGPESEAPADPQIE